MTATVNCSRCGAPMACHPGACWCERYPPLAPVDPGKGCYCESCLRSALEDSGRDQRTADKGRLP